MEISPTSSHKKAVFVTKNMAASSVTLTDVETQSGQLMYMKSHYSANDTYKRKHIYVSWNVNCQHFIVGSSLDAS